VLNTIAEWLVGEHAKNDHKSESARRLIEVVRDVGSIDILFHPDTESA